MQVVRRLTHREILAMQRAGIDENDPCLTDRQGDHLPYKRTFEAHDKQTLVLMRQYEELSRLPHGEDIVERLDRWQWLDRMATPSEKQRYLEPLISGVQRDPVAREADLIFLLIVFEPVRRAVTRELGRVRCGLHPNPARALPDWHRREESKRLDEIDRQALFDITRNAVLEAIDRYPTPSPDRLFPWLRATIAHSALNHLRHELAELQTSSAQTAAEAAAVQNFIHGLDGFEAPDMRDAPQHREWRRRIAMRSVFEVAEDYYRQGTVRQMCSTAVGRLPTRQREVIEHLFFDASDVAELTRRRGVSPSTVYNHKSQALGNLRADDVFFDGLCALGLVRDRARRTELHRRYPDGRLPDGRRIVPIDLAA